MAIYTPSSDSQEGISRLRLAYFSNEFPNDDLNELFRRLHIRSKDQRHIILAAFLEKATIALKEEIRQLPTALKKLVPPFDTILNLVDFPELRKGPLSGSVEGLLLCALEIGTFIGYHENSVEGFECDQANTFLAGLGIGLLATAAISISPSLADIPVAGAEVVRIAFRLGVLVDRVSENLQPRELDESAPADSWAYVLPDVSAEDVQKELDSIQSKEKTPEAAKVFLSALNATSVTVSGPPNRLKKLFKESEFFRDRRFVTLPVYGGLCHAGHIYDQDDIRSVVHCPSIKSLNPKFFPTIPVFSTSAGKPYPAKSVIELFECIITEVLTQKIEWDGVVEGLIERARITEASEFSLLIFRPSLPIQDLKTAINSKLSGLEVTQEEIISWIATKSSEDIKPRGANNSKIAIVGMSCRMPGGASDTEKFWELLANGMDVHRKIPADRFDYKTHCDPTGKRQNTSMTEYGCFIDEPGLFDAPFFNMSPREAAQTDPAQRLMLVTAYEALERSGYVANRTSATNLHRIGTFYGQASDDYREVNTGQEVSTYFIPGGCRAFGPGRINYFFKFEGPSFNIDTACSSSLATIQTACTSLWNNEADTVVAGGVNVLTNSDAFAGLSNGHFLTKTPNACKTWDAEADGYCRADGIGSIVMKRLEDAELDNDNILGVILGAATNHSANAVSITHPHAGAQSYLSKQVLAAAGIDPLDVSYVEMHGTGTQAGDSEEMQSVSSVYAPAQKRRNAKQPLHIGSVKANVGHGEAVAGVTALLKVLLMFQKEMIPRHVGIKNKINPGFPQDLGKRQLFIPFEEKKWERNPNKKRIAAVNNFSAAGGNTNLLIEEGPLREVPAELVDSRPSHVVAVSAKSKVSFRANLERWLAYVEANPEVNLANLGYSSTARRYHHNHRVAIHTSDVENLRKQLKSAIDKVDTVKPIPTTGPPPVAFAFTGQGSSHKSMNLQLYHKSSFFRAQINHLNSLAKGQGFPSFIRAIDGSYPTDHQHSPVVTQLALVCIEIALAKYWESLGVKPDVVVGHSLGEYAALHVAGVLSASDAIYLVGTRAAMLEERCEIGSHKMMAVRASLEQIKETVGDKSYEIACINGPKETVLSGTVKELEGLSEPLQEKGYKCFIVDVAFAFHSSQTDPVLDDFEEVAKATLFNAPNLPIISPLLGKVIFDDKSVNAKYLRRATREPVNFLSAMETAQKIATVDDTTVWIEIGPHPVATNFVKATLPSINLSTPSFRRGENNWTTLAESCAALHLLGVEINWSEFHQPFESGLRLLDLPTYAWNDKTYWIQYDGDWALTKGNHFYDAEKAAAAPKTGTVQPSELRTSTVQQIIEESISDKSGRVTMQSDLMQPDFHGAAYGHKMNDCGVITSSIHADIVYTLGDYLYKKIKPKGKVPPMNITNLVVLKGLVANKDTKNPQLLQVSIETSNVDAGTADLEWRNVRADGTVEEEFFASATIVFGNEDEWLASWVPTTHLIQGRISDLERLADEGIANRFSHNMAYTLFANNLVDYASKYRGMQAVVLNGFEAFADVILTKEKGGTWTVPPFFIDSVAHLAGFIMNVSDAGDVKNNFCVTPGWQSMRFARPLIAGNKYRSYVKMIPTAEDPNVYLGDVYILQDGIIVGMVGGIKFRRYPRLLLNRFFSAPDAGGAKHDSGPSGASKSAPTHAPKTPASQPEGKKETPKEEPKPALKEKKEEAPKKEAPKEEPKGGSSEQVEVSMDSDSTAAKAMALVAAEGGLDPVDLTDDASFANLGVDSLMSLVIAEKFRDELGITMGGSLFLEYPTVGDLRAWLLEYYS